MWDQPNRAGLQVGAKPWQVPGGLKSPRDNEGVAGAQCCGQLHDRTSSGVLLEEGLAQFRWAGPGWAATAAAAVAAV